MILGLDYFNTISAYPTIYAGLSKIIHDQGGEVYIVSAVKKGHKIEVYMDGIQRFVEENNINIDKITVFEFLEASEIPQKKLEACQELHIDYFFDDRADVVLALNNAGIPAFQAKKKKWLK